MIETFLIIYFWIAGINLLATALWMSNNSIKGINGFWDWVVYNLFWIIQPIKSVIKLFKRL